MKRAPRDGRISWTTQVHTPQWASISKTVSDDAAARVSIPQPICQQNSRRPSPVLYHTSHHTGTRIRLGPNAEPLTKRHIPFRRGPHLINPAPRGAHQPLPWSRGECKVAAALGAVRLRRFADLTTRIKRRQTRPRQTLPSARHRPVRQNACRSLPAHRAPGGGIPPPCRQMLTYR